MTAPQVSAPDVAEAVERLSEMLAARVSMPLRVDHHSELLTERGQTSRTSWAEVLCVGRRPNNLIAHCCDHEDADLIGAALELLPTILSELTRLQGVEAEAKVVVKPFAEAMEEWDSSDHAYPVITHDR